MREPFQIGTMGQRGKFRLHATENSRWEQMLRSYQMLQCATFSHPGNPSFYFYIIPVALTLFRKKHFFLDDLLGSELRPLREDKGDRRRDEAPIYSISDLHSFVSGRDVFGRGKPGCGKKDIQNELLAVPWRGRQR